MTLLLLRNNCISLHQSLNFVLSSSNYPRSRTMFLDIMACLLLFVIASTSATDIFLSDYLYVSSEALFVICKNSSLSDNASISSVHLELILVLLVVYATCILSFVWQQLHIIYLWTNHYVSLLLQGELINTLPNVMTLA